MSKPKAMIEFQQIECSRCGAPRIRALECPDCGARPDPREVNLPVQQRRQLLANIRAVMQQGTESPLEVNDLDDLAGTCDAVVDRLKSAAGKLEGPDGSSRPLHEALDYYGQARGGIRSIHPHRQRTALFQTAALVLSSMDGFVEAFLDTLVADTPLAADLAQKRGLAHLDRALAEMTDLARRDGLKKSIDLTTTASMVGSMLELLLDQNEGEVGEWIARADERVSRLLAHSGEIVVGIPFVLGELIADLEGTGADFVRSFSAAYRAFADDLPTLAQIGADAGFLADFSDGQISVFNAYWSFTSASENAVSDRQLIEALLDTHVRQVEGPGATLARVLLLTSGLKSTSYAKLARGNATESIRAARKDPRLEPLLDGLSDHLRIARSHHNIRFHNESIEATASGVVRAYSHAELIDLVLRATDSTFAGTLALRQALADAHVMIDDLADIAEFGLTSAALASITMSALAQTQVAVAVDGDLLRISAEGTLRASMSAIAAGTCASVRGPVRFQFTHTERGHTRSLTGSTVAFTQDHLNRPRSESDELAATMRTAMQLRLNGAPVVSRAAVGAFCSSLAAKALAALVEESLSAPEVARQIMVLRDLSQRAKDPELETALRMCSRWVARQDNLDQVLERLVGFATNEPLVMP